MQPGKFRGELQSCLGVGEWVLLSKETGSQGQSHLLIPTGSLNLYPPGNTTLPVTPVTHFTSKGQARRLARVA